MLYISAIIRKQVFLRVQIIIFSSIIFAKKIINFLNVISNIAVAFTYSDNFFIDY